MKTNVKTRRHPVWMFALMTVAVFMTAGMLSAKSFAAKPDFTGTWKLNEAKSEIGEGRFRPSATLEVKQVQTSLTVARIRTGRDGQERKMESVYSLDGKETKTEGQNRTTVSTAKWAEDGNSLVINSKTSFTREGQTFETKMEETWMLGDKGATLTVKSHSSSSRGESSSTAVYDKGK
jgi:hypothetical protein